MPALTPKPNQRGFNFARPSAFGAVLGTVMVALHLKERHDEYKQVSAEDDADEEAGFGRVALHGRESSPPAYRDADGDEESRRGLLSPLDTSLPGPKPRRTRAKASCCTCCGVNCSLFCKALAVTVLLFFIYGSVKLLIWAFSPTPTGLDGMPAFGVSLSCQASAATYLYKYAPQTYTLPIGSKADHALDIRGDAVGTLTLAPSTDPDATEIELELTLRSTHPELLDDVNLRMPESTDSRLTIYTPSFLHSIGKEGSCMRFDATLRVPSNLKQLHVQTHALAHVQFADGLDQYTLDDLFVTMYKPSADNLLVPRSGFGAKRVALEVFRGWIVGDVDLAERVSITTQRGNGIANVKVHPQPSASNATAVLRTVTGSGRTDITYLAGPPSQPHRQIDAQHLAQAKSDLYLHYEHADFNGLVEVDAKSYTAKGVQGMMDSAVETPWVGDKDGGDRVQVKSRYGWVGLYF